MKTWIWIVCMAAVLAGGSDPKEAPNESSTGADTDPALLRRDLLARMDAHIAAQTAQAHLDARFAVDEVMPIPYLGLDLENVAGGARITNVYPLTAAEAAGLKKDDVIRSLAGLPIDSKAALGRAIRLKPIGAPVDVVVSRGSETLTIVATPRPRPEEDEDEEEQFPDLPPRVVLSTKAWRLDAAADLSFQLDSALGGHGRPPKWVSVSEGGRSFVRQEEADRTGIRFPLAIARGFAAPDVVASARFRYSGGVVDQAAGIVVRYQDPGNYIVARANAAEADLRIFRVANGLRRTLPGAIVKCPTDAGVWHTIELRAEGPKLTATVDGKATTTSWDSYFLSGGAGLWTKSDSVSDFDEVRFEPLKAAAKPESK